MILTKDKNELERAELAERNLDKKFLNKRKISFDKGPYLSTGSISSIVSTLRYETIFWEATNYFKETECIGYTNMSNYYRMRFIEIYKENNGTRTPLIRTRDDDDCNYALPIRNKENKDDVYVWVNENLEEILLRDGIEMINS